MVNTSLVRQSPQARQGSGGTSPDVKSAVRTMQVLEFLAERQGRPARVRDVAEILDAPRSSAHALLRTLVNHGWVRADASGSLYRLGIRALLVGTAFLDADPYVRVARPILVQLAEQLHETVHLGRLDGDSIVYLATQEGRRDVRTTSRVGRRLPSYATGMGKAILATQPEAVPTHLEPLTEHTITDRDTLLAHLARVREQEYALDNEESSLNLCCVAYALRYTDPRTDAISCSVPKDRMSSERRKEIARAMDDARHQIEASAPLQGSF